LHCVQGPASTHLAEIPIDAMAQAAFFGPGKTVDRMSLRM